MLCCHDVFLNQNITQYRYCSFTAKQSILTPSELTLLPVMFEANKLFIVDCLKLMYSSTYLKCSVRKALNTIMVLQEKHSFPT